MARTSIFYADRVLNAKDSAVDLWMWRGERPRVLQQVSGLLRPGVWRTARLARRIGADKPLVSLHEDVVLSEAMQATLFARGGYRSYHDLRWTAMTVADCADADNAPDGFRADVWALRHSGKHLLFDLSSSRVMRWRTDPFTGDYVGLRRAFERHVPSAAFDIGADQHLIIEEYCAGSNLLQVDSGVADDVVGRIFDGLASLVRHELIETTTTDRLRSAIATARISEAVERQDEILALLGDAGAVPSTGDLHPTHVLMDQSGTFRVIDFDFLDIQPCWYDAWLLAKDLPHLWWTGALDDHVDRIFLEAGLAPISARADWRRLMSLAGWSILHARQDRWISGPLAALRRYNARSKRDEHWTTWLAEARCAPCDA